MSINSLAELFVKEPSSLEILLMLKDEGPKTVGQVSKDILYDTNVTDLLDKLKTFGMIDIKDNLIDITIRGRLLMSKMRKRLEEI